MASLSCFKKLKEALSNVILKMKLDKHTCKALSFSSKVSESESYSGSAGRVSHLSTERLEV